jgi:hypothetical protein
MDGRMARSVAGGSTRATFFAATEEKSLNERGNTEN